MSRLVGFMQRGFGTKRDCGWPVEVDTEKIDAAFKKGVLTVTLPKTPKAVAETKKIAVKVE